MFCFCCEPFCVCTGETSHNCRAPTQTPQNKNINPRTSLLVRLSNSFSHSFQEREGQISFHLDVLIFVLLSFSFSRVVSLRTKGVIERRWRKCAVECLQ